MEQDEKEEVVCEVRKGSVITPEHSHHPVFHSDPKTIRFCSWLFRVIGKYHANQLPT